jgi:hypothetical protein
MQAANGWAQTVTRLLSVRESVHDFVLPPDVCTLRRPTNHSSSSHAHVHTIFTAESGHCMILFVYKGAAVEGKNTDFNKGVYFASVMDTSSAH